MADIRINSLPSTATSFNTDDYIAIDGASGGTRKMLAATLPLTDVTLGGSSGPSVKSTLSARAPRQGLVYDGTAGATATISALGTAPFTVSAVFSAKSLAANNVIIDYNTVGYSILIYVKPTGILTIYDRAANVALYNSNTGVIEVNKIYHIAYSRGVGVFVNGVNISGSFADGSNYTDTVYRIGWAASNDSFCTGFLSIFIYNRALSASEVVSLYEAGAPAGADYNNATNTSLITGDNSTFASDTGYWTLAAGATISGGNLNLAGNGSRADRTLPLSVGKKYRAVAVVTANTATDLILGSSTGGSYAILSGTGTLTGEFVASSTSFTIYQNGAGAITVDSITLVPIGLLLAPDAAQAGGGLTWYDTSGNAANITLPASGVSWNVPSSQKTASGWTFGGNLTVSSSSAYLKLASTGSSNTWDLFSDSNGSFYLSQSGVVNALRVFPTTGNVSIGAASIDGGQKLQVSGNSGFLGHLEIPADKHIYMKQSNPLRWSSDGLSTGSVRADVYADSGGALYLRTNGANTALTLDSSQNATFAGKVGIGVSPLSWNLNLQQSAVNSAVRIISPTALGLNDSSIYIAWASGSKALIAASYESTGSYRPLVLSAGGVDSLTLDTSGNATFAGGIIGMTQGNVDNISDDGVASFTPLYNRGFIVINNPDYSQNALIAYFKAGSSYLLYSITKSADVTLNNSTTLTGTTGTDGKLNIGYNNSIIYIENRLGGIGNFQRYALGGTNN